MSQRKLSNTNEILALMRDGWELGLCSDIRSNVWLQKPGLCKGGESRQVHASTWFSMLKKKLIVKVEKQKGDAFWLTRYKENA